MKLTLHQRDQQLAALQQEHLDLLKQFTSTQETLQGREQALGDLQVRYDELQARLEELQGEATSKDDTIRFLQNEKIVLEVALQAAKSSGEELDRGVRSLEEGAEETSEILEQLRQELAVKSSQVMNAICPHFVRIPPMHVSVSANGLVLSLNPLFCKMKVCPGLGPGLS